MLTLDKMSTATAGIPMPIPTAIPIISDAEIDTDTGSLWGWIVAGLLLLAAIVGFCVIHNDRKRKEKDNQKSA